jgi:zinc transporter ZupT
LSRHLAAKTTAEIQHFAAGIMFCAVAVELLPPLHSQSPTATLVGFTAGIAAVVAIRQLSRRLQQGGKLGSAGLIITTAVDVLIDGLVIGTAFASGGNRGLLMVAAISLEFLFLGMSSAVWVRQRSSIELQGPCCDVRYRWLGGRWNRRWGRPAFRRMGGPSWPAFWHLAPSP